MDETEDNMPDDTLVSIRIAKIHLAAAWGDIEFLQAYVAENSDDPDALYETDEEGNTALVIAGLAGHDDCMDLIIGAIQRNGISSVLWKSAATLDMLYHRKKLANLFVVLKVYSSIQKESRWYQGARDRLAHLYFDQLDSLKENSAAQTKHLKKIFKIALQAGDIAQGIADYAANRLMGAEEEGYLVNDRIWHIRPDPQTCVALIKRIGALNKDIKSHIEKNRLAGKKRKRVAIEQESDGALAPKKINDSDEFMLEFVASLPDYFHLPVFSPMLPENQETTRIDEPSRLISAAEYLLAAENNDIETVRAYLAHAFLQTDRNRLNALNVVDADGKTALILAALRGHVGVVELLLSQEGLKINTACHAPHEYLGLTAILAAAWRNHPSIVERLLTIPGIILIPANINTFRDTPLHWMAHWGQMDCVKHLLWAGADPLLKDHINRTPANRAYNQCKWGLTNFMRAAEKIYPLVNKKQYAEALDIAIQIQQAEKFPDPLWDLAQLLDLRHSSGREKSISLSLVMKAYEAAPPASVEFYRFARWRLAAFCLEELRAEEKKAEESLAPLDDVIREGILEKIVFYGLDGGNAAQDSVHDASRQLMGMTENQPGIRVKCNVKTLFKLFDKVRKLHEKYLKLQTERSPVLLSAVRTTFFAVPESIRTEKKAFALPVHEATSLVFRSVPGKN